jgi:hypothetical protein
MRTKAWGLDSQCLSRHPLRLVRSRCKTRGGTPGSKSHRDLQVLREKHSAPSVAHTSASPQPSIHPTFQHKKDTRPILPGSSRACDINAKGALEGGCT